MAEWQDTMSSAEFAEWLAFDRISPDYPERGDIQAALIATTVANRGRKKPLPLNDFLLKFGQSKVKERVSQSAIASKLKMWMMAHNKKEAPSMNNKR